MPDIGHAWNLLPSGRSLSSHAFLPSATDIRMSSSIEKKWESRTRYSSCELKRSPCMTVRCSTNPPLS
ncbi:hypothetical protein TNCV_4115311 [Trichonephila clavipes]|nr:hypothetical protein TNCV_4115311 [Trichonephila clavipes]